MSRKPIIFAAIIFACVGAMALHRHERSAHAERAEPEPERVLSATRAPDAPPPPSVSRDPRVTRDRLRGRLVQSGPAPSDNSDGSALIRSVGKLQPGVVLVGPGDCWAAGCTARVTVRRGGEFPKWQRELSHALKRQWKGGVVVTGPEDQPDGAAQCSLFLFNDNQPQEKRK